MDQHLNRPGKPTPSTAFTHPPSCGYYLTPQPDGFVLHLTASPEHVRWAREAVFRSVAAAGDEEAADSVRLVAGELIGNAVRHCGPCAPVVVQLHRRGRQVLLSVHDPEGAALPWRARATPDGGQAEAGRGLWIVDTLAPGWCVRPTQTGKRVSCAVPLPRGQGAAVGRADRTGR